VPSKPIFQKAEIEKLRDQDTIGPEDRLGTMTA
jgi:hypothetical protein